MGRRSSPSQQRSPKRGEVSMGPAAVENAPVAEVAAPMQGSQLARRDWTPYVLLAPNLIWILLFMAGALLMLAVISFRGYEAGGKGITDSWELTHYLAFLGDPFYRAVLWRSLGMSAEVTLWCLLLGFPLAYMLSRSRGYA